MRAILIACLIAFGTFTAAAQQTPLPATDLTAAEITAFIRGLEPEGVPHCQPVVGVATRPDPVPRARVERIVAAALEPGAVASEVARAAGHLPLGTFDRQLGRLEGAQRL